MFSCFAPRVLFPLKVVSRPALIVRQISIIIINNKKFNCDYTSSCLYTVKIKFI